MGFWRIYAEKRTADCSPSMLCSSSLRMGDAFRGFQDAFAPSSKPLPQSRADPGHPCHQRAARKANS
jgi:hypothetical protein